MRRREFLRVGAAGIAGVAASSLGAVSWAPRAHAATINKTLYITGGYIALPDAGGSTNVYHRGFSTSSNGLDVPARPMLVQEGDTINMTVVNRLSRSHSFKIDGVVDSGSIRGGRSRSFSFTAPAAGTYMFYCGLTEPYGRLTGLHGGLGVMPAGSSNELYAGSPTFSQQYFWVVNEIDPAWNARIANGYTPNTAFVPRHFTLNGMCSRPPGAPGHGDPNLDAMANPDTKIHGHVGDRTLIRVLNAGLCVHSMHWHANHVEWLATNGQPRASIWKKDVLRLPNDRGGIDVIYPFEPPPDAWPPVTTGMYPMHLHDEMTQTSNGGSYLFGAMTDILFE